MSTKERNQKGKKSVSSTPESSKGAVGLKKNGSPETSQTKSKEPSTAAKSVQSAATSKQVKNNKPGKTAPESPDAASKSASRRTQKPQTQDAPTGPKLARAAKNSEPVGKKSKEASLVNKLIASNQSKDAEQAKPSPSGRKKVSQAANAKEQSTPAEPYVTTLPEFENDLDLLSYFGIDLFDPIAVSPDGPDLESMTEPSSDLIDFAPEAPDETDSADEPTGSLEADPIEELALLLATAEEAEALKSKFEMLHALREEDIALKEVEVIRLNDLSFGQINNAVAHLSDEAHALVEGKSQAFFHDRSSGKIFGKEVYAFVYDHATVESVESCVIAAGRAVIYADGGWIGAKDEAIVHAKGNSTVQAAGDAIVVAEGNSSIEAAGTAAVLVNSPTVRVRLISEDACIILMDLQMPIPEIETPDRNPPKIHQLVSIDSPLGLEKMMELSFREAQRRERLSWDYS
jgi:hypothetical protein